mgnify:CR=1 FL=1|jgi:Flp pilus assembly pilin Flp
MKGLRLFRCFRRDETGASSLEFTLLAVPLILLTFVIVQFMMLAHAMVVIKGAAHAAARSALVNKCRPPSVAGVAGNPLGAAAGALVSSCSDQAEKWETAARLALVPISASYDRGGNCDYPEALVELLQEDAVRTSLAETLEHKACYAFEPENVTVQVEWESQIFGLHLTDTPPPVTATVTFRVPLLAPMRKVFGGSAGTVGGTYYWQGEATVTLL